MKVLTKKQGKKRDTQGEQRKKEKDKKEKRQNMWKKKSVAFNAQKSEQEKNK